MRLCTGSQPAALWCAALQAGPHCNNGSAQLQATGSYSSTPCTALHCPALQIELHCVEDAIHELKMARSRDSAEAAAQLQEAQEAAMQRLHAASQRSSSVLQRAVSMQQQRPQVQLQLQVSFRAALLSIEYKQGQQHVSVACGVHAAAAAARQCRRVHSCAGGCIAVRRSA